MAGAFWQTPAFAKQAAVTAQQAGDTTIVEVSVETTGSALATSNGSDVSSAQPTLTGTVLASFTVATAGHYWIQNQSASNLQVWFDDGLGNSPSVQILGFGPGAGQPGADTGVGIPWFTGRIRIVGPAGAQFMARHN